MLEKAQYVLRAMEIRMAALAVTKVKKPGMHPDGGGLYLQVSKSGAKSWIYRYTLNGKARYMGLGPLDTVSLSEARKKADVARQLRHEGIDPIEARETEFTKARLAAAKAITFKDAATSYIEAHRAGWSSPKSERQWRVSLASYAYPVIGALSIQSVDVGLVLKVIEPIWAEKPVTASRIRGRIESILDWATARGYRRGDNPARWRGHLENLLPKRIKVRRVRHFPALPYGEIGAFMGTLHVHEGMAPRALEFVILTAARTSEVIGARWGEFDLSGAIWEISAERVKSRLVHRVPLSPAALAVLKTVWIEGVSTDDDYVFPGAKGGKPLSSMAMLMLLKHMERSDLTVHGFRSTFRDWAAEQTNFPRDVAEAALAHVISDAVERAYRRGDLFAKRKQLMGAWARFCAAPATSGEVVPLRGGALS